MYLRYFFWNFSGKQDDLQGLYAGNVRDGNWITGISFMITPCMAIKLICQTA